MLEDRRVPVIAILCKSISDLSVVFSNSIPFFQSVNIATFVTLERFIASVECKPSFDLKDGKNQENVH